MTSKWEMCCHLLSLKTTGLYVVFICFYTLPKSQGKLTFYEQSKWRSSVLGRPFVPAFYFITNTENVQSSPYHVPSKYSYHVAKFITSLNFLPDFFLSRITVTFDVVFGLRLFFREFNFYRDASTTWFFRFCSYSLFAVQIFRLVRLPSFLTMLKIAV